MKFTTHQPVLRVLGEQAKPTLAQSKFQDEIRLRNDQASSLPRCQALEHCTTLFFTMLQRQVLGTKLHNGHVLTSYVDGVYRVPRTVPRRAAPKKYQTYIVRMTYQALAPAWLQYFGVLTTSQTPTPIFSQSLGLPGTRWFSDEQAIACEPQYVSQ